MSATTGTMNMGDKPLQTWYCGCHGVKISLSHKPNAYGDCFCDDCAVRLKVCKDKYEKEAGAPCNKLMPNGALGFVNVAAKSMTIDTGRDQIGLFRAPVVFKGPPYAGKGDFKGGSEYRPHHVNVKGRATATMYTKCCGTLLGILPEQHPWAMDIQPHGLVGWSRDMVAAPDGNAKQLIFGTFTDGYTGVPIPQGLKPIYGPARINPCDCQTLCGVVCCGGIVADCIPQMCGQDPKEDIFKKVPAEAKEHAGVTIEYIDDPKYLFPKPQVLQVNRH